MFAVVPEFADRREAGRRLANRLALYRRERPLIYGLPRGGVVVAHEIATALAAPLDVLLVRKIGAPRQPELAVAAVAEGEPPIRVINDDIVRALALAPAYLDMQTALQGAEIARRQTLYRGGRSRRPATGRVAIVVDDGLATGATARAALTALAADRPARRILAVPVAAPDSVAMLADCADAVICLVSPPELCQIGAYYDDFDQVEDETVMALLAGATQDRG